MARYPGVSVDDIHDGPLPGFYEVVVGGQVSYVTTDARLLFRGEIIDLATQRNLTEARRAENRAAMLASVDPAKEIVFSPADGVVKHRITVFTDVDCGYCRQLHSQIALYNALGIEVRYMAYPRTGPNTESWYKAEHVWCASDRQANLTRAKLGGDVPAVPGCTAPVAEQYELGRRVGVTGTPTVFSEGGVELGGYVAPDALLARLEKLDAERH